ncbi:streptococcal hemagglutinin-like isoform X2 [Neodiprion pinetum]|uniref:streptococcal hemagglutinin-like isoform X2 n=1 Tax=Neodiprion pinetum TaxID=441929 RepID=UPI00371710FD
MQGRITRGYFIVVALFLACCWMNPNDAIPHQIRSRTKKQVSLRVNHKSAANTASLSYDALGHLDLRRDRKSVLPGGREKWRSLKRTLSSGEFPWTVMEPLKVQAKNCTEPHNSDDRYSSSFNVNSTVKSIYAGNDFEVAGEAETKRTSSVHVGEDITLCWIETTTIKEDHHMHPVQRQVLREYTISFENAATIPERYLECIQLEGEVDSTDSSFPKSTLFEVVDENTRHSRVVNFTTVSHTDDLTVWQHKRVQCGVGPVVTKNIIEWAAERAEHPKRRIEIKVSPKIHRLTAVPTETEPCTTDLIDWQVTSTTTSSFIVDCGPGSTCESYSDCAEENCGYSSTSEVDVSNNLWQEQATTASITLSDSSESETSVTTTTEVSTAMSSNSYNQDCGPGSTCESYSDCADENCGYSSISETDVTDDLQQEQATTASITLSDSSESEILLTTTTEVSTAMSSNSYNQDCSPGSTCESYSDCADENCGYSSISETDVTDDLRQEQATTASITLSDSSESEILLTTTTEVSTAMSSNSYNQDCSPGSTCESYSDCADENCGYSSISETDVTDDLRQEQATTASITLSDSSESETSVTTTTEVSTAMSSISYNEDCGPGSTCESYSDCADENCGYSSISEIDVTDDLRQEQATTASITLSDSSESEILVTTTTEVSTAMSSNSYNQDCSPGSICESYSDCADENCGYSSISETDVTDDLRQEQATTASITLSDSSESETSVTTTTEVSTAMSSNSYNQDCSPGSTCESYSDCADENCGYSSISETDVTDDLRQEQATTASITLSDSSESEILLTTTTEVSTAMSSNSYNQDCSPGSTCESYSDCADENCGYSSISETDVTDDLRQEQATTASITLSDSSESETSVTTTTEVSTAMSSISYNEDCGPGSTCESYSDCADENCGYSSISEIDVTDDLRQEQATTASITLSDSSESEILVTTTTEVSTAMSSNSYNQDCSPGSTCESYSDCADENCGYSSISETDVTDDLRQEQATTASITLSDSSESETSVTTTTEVSTAMSSNSYNQDCSPGSTCESYSDCADENCGYSSISETDVTDDLRQEQATTASITLSDSSESETSVTTTTEVSTAMSSNSYNQDCSPGSTCESYSDCADENCGYSSISETDVTDDLRQEQATTASITLSDSSESETLVTTTTEVSTAMSSISYNQDCGPGSTCESYSDCADENCGYSSISETDVTDDLWQEQATTASITLSDSSESESETSVATTTEVSTAMSSISYNQDCSPGSTCESYSDCADENCGYSSISETDVTDDLRQEQATTASITLSDSSESETSVTTTTEVSTAMSSNSYNQDCSPGSTCESYSDCADENCGYSSISETDVTDDLRQEQATTASITLSDSSESKILVTTTTEVSTAMSSNSYNQDCSPGSTCESYSDCADENCGYSSISETDVTDDLRQEQATTASITLSDSSESETSVTTTTEVSTAMSSISYNEDCGPGSTCESYSDCADENCGYSSISEIDVTDDLRQEQATTASITLSDSSESKILVTTTTEVSTAMSSNSYNQDCSPGSTCESYSDCADENCGYSSISETDVTDDLRQEQATTASITLSDSSESETSVTTTTEVSTAMSSISYNEDCGPGSTCESYSDCADENCGYSSISETDVTDDLRQEQATTASITLSDSSELETSVTTTTEVSTAMSSISYNEDCGPGSTCESYSDCADENCGYSSISETDVTDDLRQEQATTASITLSDSSESETSVTTTTEVSTAMSSISYNQDCGPGSTCESYSDCADENCGYPSISDIDVTDDLRQEPTTAAYIISSNSLESETSVTAFTEASTAMFSIANNEHKIVNYLPPPVFERPTPMTDQPIDPSEATTASLASLYDIPNAGFDKLTTTSFHEITTSALSDVKSPEFTEDVSILSVTMNHDIVHDVETGDQTVDFSPANDDSYFSPSDSDETSKSNASDETSVSCESGGSCVHSILFERTTNSWEDETSIETETRRDGKKTNIEQLPVTLTTDTGYIQITKFGSYDSVEYLADKNVASTTKTGETHNGDEFSPRVTIVGLLDFESNRATQLPSCDSNLENCSYTRESTNSSCDKESGGCSPDNLKICDSDSTGSCASPQHARDFPELPSMTSSTPIEVSNTSTTMNDVPTINLKQRHKLGLRIKILLEHVDDNKEKQKLVEVNKHLLFREQADEQTDQTLINQIGALNNNIDIQTVQALFNCSTVEKLAGDLGNISAEYLALHGGAKNIRVNNSRNSHWRKKRDVSSLSKRDVDSNLKMSLPEILADVHAGLDHVMSQIPSEHAVVKRSGRMIEHEIPQSHILELISNPQDNRIHARIKRNIGINDVAINEKDMPKDLQEVGHWSNEGVRRGLNSGYVRTLTEFTIYRGP